MDKGNILKTYSGLTGHMSCIVEVLSSIPKAFLGVGPDSP